MRILKAKTRVIEETWHVYGCTFVVNGSRDKQSSTLEVMHSSSASPWVGPRDFNFWRGKMYCLNKT